MNTHTQRTVFVHPTIPVKHPRPRGSQLPHPWVASYVVPKKKGPPSCNRRPPGFHAVSQGHGTPTNVWTISSRWDWRPVQWSARS